MADRRLEALYDIRSCSGDVPFGLLYTVVRKLDGKLFQMRAIEYSAYATRQLALLEQEVRLARCFKHPGLTRVVEVIHDTQARAYYLIQEHNASEGVIELINGLSKEPLPEGRIITAVEQLCEALAVMHETTYRFEDETANSSSVLFHGAINPTNLCLTDDGMIKLVTLGIGREVHTGWSILEHTPHKYRAYVAPELHESNTPTPSTDMWALGVLLYELCTGHSYRPHQVELPLNLADYPILSPILTQLLSPDPSKRLKSAALIGLLKSH
ncbi:Kinase, NEK [Giardia muris]|uniref:non-specific serine/threonine protein kinase n=1 Tax=Giardia muris TaxID=5742 RepID=A0A4Z1TA95_GIAMU|nr:Kinase, NEK [Giardia muris]|eukprot:TNJ29439.1 Kinase, NEK [Giardia muris]